MDANDRANMLKDIGLACTYAASNLNVYSGVGPYTGKELAKELLMAIGSGFLGRSKEVQVEADAGPLTQTPEAT